MSKPLTAALAGAGTEGARRVNMPVGQRFAEASTYDAAARTVELVGATETPVRTPGWMLGLDVEYYLEILDCSRAAVDLTEVEAGNAPLLDTHDRWSLEGRLGVVRSVRFEEGKVLPLVAFGQSARAKEAEAEFAGGTPPKTSVGYRREEMRFERMDGEVPVYRVTRWRFVEQSLCSIAADLNAGVRSEGSVISPCVIKENVMADQAQEANGAAAPTHEEATPAIEAAPAPAAADGERSASKRRHPMMSASEGLTLMNEARSLGESVATRAQELIDQNAADKISPLMVRSQLFSATAEHNRASTGGISTGGRSIQMGQDEADKFVQGATNSIMIRAGLADMVRAAAEKRGEKIDLDPGEFAGVFNVELARMAIERAGERVASYDRHEVVKQAIMLRSGPYQTTSTFTNILENVMHKTLQAGYAVAPDTWSRFCGIGSVTDFRPHLRLLKGTFGSLDDLLENGEFKNKPIPDAAKESISAKTKGNIVALSRHAIVNDDMSAFSDMTVELARSAKLSIEKDVYALLALNSGLGPVMNDGLTLFHADHRNIAATGAAPSVDSIGALRNLMGSQLDVSNNEVLDISPAIFLGPRALADKAKVVNTSEYDPDTANKLQRANIERGTYTDIIGTARLSGTRWYNFADPSQAPAIEVVFLNGQQEPYTEMRDGWRVDGTEWKVRHDYGVGAMNWRSAATNAGA